jgi:hypothetical protein
MQGLKPPGEAWLVLLKKGGKREKEKRITQNPMTVVVPNKYLHVWGLAKIYRLLQ